MARRVDWARAVLARGNWTMTTALLQGLVAVCVGEGSQAVDNPADDELREPSSTDYNSAGVQNYDSWDEGVEAVVLTLNNGYYPRTGAVLAAGGPAAAFVTAWAEEPWGTWDGNVDAALADLAEVTAAWPNGPATVEVAGSPPVTPPLPAPATGASPATTPTTEEAFDMAAQDTISGGTWVVDSTGAVYSFDGAPYLGGLNNHPEWAAGGTTDPVLGIAPWKGDGTDAGGNGYVIACQAAPGQTPALYRFPRSAVYAQAPAAA